jgi:hypothetical protein
LVNAGITSSSASAKNAQNQSDLEEQLESEKQTNNDLREIVKTQQLQMDEMKKKFQDSEEELKKKQAETDVLIKGLISMLPGYLPR